MEKMLKDKVALITGSGRGIGRAAALLLALEGARVLVSDIDAAPAEETVSEIQKNGGEAFAFIGDVTTPDFAENILKAAADRWGALHIIVNNAGFTWDGLIHKMSDEQYEKMIDLHLKAPFRIIRAAKPYFCDAAKSEIREGKSVARKIVNVSSVAGLGGNIGQANYAAAKAGVIGLTKTVSREWARYNVQANVVAFGFIDTRLTQEKEKGIAVEVGDQRVALGLPSKQREVFTRAMALGRPGTVDEAAGVILFFASPLSDYVTGQVLAVDGGL